MAETGHRPFIPESFPSHIRDIVELCWNADPFARPQWHAIVAMLTMFDPTQWLSDNGLGSECSESESTDTRSSSTSGLPAVSTSDSGPVETGLSSVQSQTSATTAIVDPDINTTDAGIFDRARNDPAFPLYTKQASGDRLVNRPRSNTVKTVLSLQLSQDHWQHEIGGATDALRKLFDRSFPAQSSSDLASTDVGSSVKLDCEDKMDDGKQKRVLAAAVALREALPASTRTYRMKT